MTVPAPSWVILPEHDYAIRFSFDHGHASAMTFRVYASQLIGTGIFIGEDYAQSLADWDDAFCVINGTLKWDGCINWQTNPVCMVHGCSPSHMDDLTAIFQTVYRIGKRHMDLLGDEVKPLPEGALEIT